jgi:nucleoid DNA-binding protein
MSARRNIPDSQSKIVRKSDLMKMLREMGLSKRKAAQAVNAVFGLMTRALWRGENVELPIGWIKAVQTPPKRKRRYQKFRNIQTGELFRRLISPPKRMIKFRAHPELVLRGRDALPPPSPLPPETQQKVEELERLYLQLAQRPLTLPVLEALMKAVVDPNKPELDANRPENLDRLLARLRHIKKNHPSCKDLPIAVQQLYWIR